METVTLPGLGWIPDIPSVQDYTPDTPAITQLLAKGNEAARAAGPTGGGAPRAHSGGGGTGAAMAMAATPTLQATVDWRAYFSPIEDQLTIGSCTANAAVALVEYYEKRASNSYLDASRLFVYKTTRNLLGWTGDVGAYIRTTMGALVLFGAPPEKFFQYNAQNVNTEPSAFCYAFGENFKAIQYYRLDPNGAAPATVLNNIRTFLNAGYPSMFGLPVYNEFDSPVQGKIAYPGPNSRSRGGHAIVAAGYDDDMMIGQDKGALLVRNSWGTGWGLGGYAWLSYKYVTAGLAQDWWTLLKEEWVQTGQFGVVA